MTTVRRLPVLWLILLQSTWCAATVFSQVALQRAPSAGNEIDAKLKVSVDRGFRYLLSKKRASGDFDAEFPVAVDALVGLAFLAGGYTERTGPPEYAAAVRACTTGLLNRQLPCGYFDDGKSRMYGHGFATLYFAELYGMSHGRRNIQDALRRALRVIEISQGQDGGWDYEPHAQCGGSVTGASDTSITVCQTMALRAARNLGVAVNTHVVKNARRYIEAAQNPDGGFRYRSQLGNYVLDKSAFPRSAAGVCILYSLGDYNSAAIRKGFSYLKDRYRRPSLYPYYGQYYCAQAMFQAGGTHWKEYYAFMRDVLLRRQEPDGGWRALTRENDVQATAMVLIVLELSYRLLPILER